MRRQTWIHAMTLVFVYLVCAASAWTPLNVAPAMAQPLCLGGTVWDAEAKACVTLDPSPTPTEEGIFPTASATEVSIAEPTLMDEYDGKGPDEAAPTEAGDLSPTPGDGPRNRASTGTSIGLYAYGCPSYTNVLPMADWTAVNACPEGIVKDVSFHLTVDGVSQGTQGPNNGGHGSIWNDVPAGLVQVTITPPDNYRQPMMVECSIGDETSSGTSRFSDSTGTSGLTSFGFFLADEGSATCYLYFNEQPTGAVRLEVLRCPNGIDIYSVSPQELQASCTTPISGVGFSLTSPTWAYHVSSTFVGAVFYPLPEGSGTVTMFPPAGIGLPNVFCETTRDGRTLSSFDWVYVSIDASFEVSIPHDALVSCQVYIVNGGIPVEQGHAGPEIARNWPLSARPAASSVHRLERM